ncbi:hypothetical protein CTAYLR_001370 [Chrysophaeum taylorii]|uniref:EF-hand domain-containing protein n=1 Tax=Chrysophaeum taylorii TaxID=2483200 RepID=A0AAD7U544_9STRA|nr:hypothetical protein CTAYLR_001370 [Chrysophaeum taylorii]
MKVLVVWVAIAFADEASFSACRWQTTVGNQSVWTVSSNELEEALLGDGYDKSVRPGVAATKEIDAPTENVSVHMHLLSFAIDEIDQTMTARGYFRWFWRDQRLAYESPWEYPGACEEPEQVWNLSPEREIWRPDLYAENYRESNILDEETGKLTWIYPDGSVFYSRYLNAVFECKIKAQKMPFDSHVCSIDVSSYSYSATHVRITAEENGIDPDSTRSNAIWELDRTSARSELRYYHDSVWPFVTLRIHITRRSKYHKIYSMVPAAIFLAIVYAGFFIDRTSAPARVGISVTSVLILRLLLNSVFAGMETVSYEIYLTQFLTIALVFGCVSVGQYGVVQYYMHEEQRAVSRRWTLEKLKGRTNTRMESVRSRRPKSRPPPKRSSSSNEETKNDDPPATTTDDADDQCWDNKYLPSPRNPIWDRDVEYMKALFDRFDSDDSGRIEAREASNVLRYYGVFVDTNHARDLILNWRFMNKLQIPVDHRNVSLNFAQFQDFLSNYENYSLGEADTKKFLFQPRSLQCDVVCRYCWFPVVVITYLLHWVAWFR